MPTSAKVWLRRKAIHIIRILADHIVWTSLLLLRLRNRKLPMVKLSAPDGSATAYIVSTPADLPEHPGDGWTRFVCISDTHSKQKFWVPPGDVLLHAGDLSSYGTHSALARTIEWLQTMSHPTKIIIGGNHDLCLDQKHYGYDEAAVSLIHSEPVVDAGIRYVEHASLRFTTVTGREWRVYGSPAVPRYFEGAFQYSTPEEADAIYGCIPEDTEILLTHTPPYMIQDCTRRGKHAGCPRLASRVTDLKACRLHVFGHIHEAHGASFRAESESNERVQYLAVNAALYGGGQPAVVDLRN